MERPAVFDYQLLDHALIVGALLIAVGLVGFITRRNLPSLLLGAGVAAGGVILSLAAVGNFYGNRSGEAFALMALFGMLRGGIDRGGGGNGDHRQPGLARHFSLARFGIGSDCHRSAGRRCRRRNSVGSTPGRSQSVRHGSTVFDPEAQTRRELAEVSRTGRTAISTLDVAVILIPACAALACFAGTLLELLPATVQRWRLPTWGAACSFVAAVMALAAFHAARSNATAVDAVYEKTLYRLVSLPGPDGPTIDLGLRATIRCPEFSSSPSRYPSC